MDGATLSPSESGERSPLMILEAEITFRQVEIWADISSPEILAPITFA